MRKIALDPRTPGAAAGAGALSALARNGAV